MPHYNKDPKRDHNFDNQPDDDVEFDVDDCDDGDAAATAAADGDEYGEDVVDDGGDGVLGDGSVWNLLFLRLS